MPHWRSVRDVGDGNESIRSVLEAQDYVRGGGREKKWRERGQVVKKRIGAARKGFGGNEGFILNVDKEAALGGSGN